MVSLFRKKLGKGVFLIKAEKLEEVLTFLPLFICITEL